VIVPTLRVGIHPLTLCVTWRRGRNLRRLRNAERSGRHSHAERGNDQRSRSYGQSHSQSHGMHVIPLWDRLQPGRGQSGRHQFCSVPPDAFPAKAGPTMSSSSPLPLPLPFLRKKSRHHKTRLGCRPSAGFAQWAEPHGCGESAVRTWMSVRRGPTEQDRSEGTRRRRAKPGAGTLGYLGMVRLSTFPSNSPKAKRLPLGRRS